MQVAASSKRNETRAAEREAREHIDREGSGTREAIGSKAREQLGRQEGAGGGEEQREAVERIREQGVGQAQRDVHHGARVHTCRAPHVILVATA